MSVTLHTDVGDIKIECFYEDCPKTVENFLALCASDYYNGSLFHRNIKGFIVQTGDPTGKKKNCDNQPQNITPPWSSLKGELVRREAIMYLALVLIERVL